MATQGTSINLLLSGASGFIGTALNNFLNNKGNYAIQELVRSNVAKKSNSIHWDELSQASTNAKVFIHLAGKAQDLKQGAKAEIYTQVNTNLSIALFQFFLDSAAEKFIFMSSVKAAADELKETLLEEMPCKPKSPYGISKLAAEEALTKMLINWNKQHPERPKQLFILRPCMVHGPGNKGNLNALYTLMQKGIPYPLGAFHNKRSFLSIENLCFVMKEMIDRDLPGGIFQVADDEPISTNELIQLMAESQGKKPKIWFIPAPLIRILASIGDWLKLPFNTERLAKLTQSYVVSNQKIKMLLGKEFPISAREGLRQTIQSFNSESKRQ